MQPTRVPIAENEDTFRKGMVAALSHQPQVEVVSQVASGKEIIEKARETKADVVIMSTDLPDIDGLDLARRLGDSLPQAKVAVISRVEQGPGALSWLEAGVKACFDRSGLVNVMVKSLDMMSGGRITVGGRVSREFKELLDQVASAVDDAVRIIEMISVGRIVIAPTLAGELVEQLASAERDDSAEPDRAHATLSKREREIAVLIAEGHRNREIAKELFVTENTVKGHVKNALRKLELRNRQQLAVYAVLQHWVKATEPAASATNG